jgi:hypothetical protein
MATAPKILLIEDDSLGAQTTKGTVKEIGPWRDLYRQEMNCQIIHDSIHSRQGWTLEYFLGAGGVPVGYGSIAVDGPWKDQPTIYEFYVLPHYWSLLFDLFSPCSRSREQD